MSTRESRVIKSFGAVAQDADESRKEIVRIISRGTRKASPLSWSLALLMFVGGCFVYFNKDVFLEWQKNAAEMNHLKDENHMLQAEIVRLQQRVARLEEMIFAQK